MDNNTILYLTTLANKYETKEFITQDPISFPHRYKEKKDIEIAAFVAQWLAYGKRELFLKVLDRIGENMQSGPYKYIMNREFDVFATDSTNLYRFYKKTDFYSLCLSLYNVYANEGKGVLSFEDVLKNRLQNEKDIDCLKIISEIQILFQGVKGVPCDLKSACKRLCMFLRWLIRKDSEVDFGLWNLIEPCKLIIPLDVHVFRQSKRLGLTDRNDTSMKTAIDITNRLKTVFPSDPTKMDFALFGVGVNDGI